MPYSVGIDYTAALKQGGGIGRYVRSLIGALATADQRNDYRLFAAGSTPTSLPRAIGSNFTWCPTRIDDQWLVRLWYRLHAPLQIERWLGPIDLLHAPDFLLPPVKRRTRTILTVHDLSFIRSPETTTDGLRRFLNKEVPRSVRRAEHILADSAATKDDLIELYGTPEEKITVLYSGVDSRFEPIIDQAVLQSVRQKYGIGEADFIMTLGTVQPRKNYVRLVEAFEMLGRHDLKLVIVGGKGWLAEPLFERIEALQLQERVILPGFADDVDLPALYNAAAAFAFPSLYEGFGLPVLEAMACGTPTLASNVSSVPEVTGNAAVLIDPLDVDAMRDGLSRLLVDVDLRRRLIADGLERAKTFTWGKAAHQLLAVYAALLSDNSGSFS